MAIAGATIFVACKKTNTEKKINTVGTQKPIENLLKTEKLKPPTISAIPITETGLTERLSCYDSWISTWLSSLSPEALKVVFEDYPFLKAYVVNFNQKINDFNVSILTVRNENNGEDLSLIRKYKGTIENEKFTGEFVLCEMNGTEILHNTYVAGVRTKEINNMKIKHALILGFSASFVGTLIANLLFQRDNFNEQIIINSLSVALTLALFFLIYFKVRKKDM